MKKGTKVTWTENGTAGSGVTISDEDNGHVLVAIDAAPGSKHPVIWCATTWLTAAP